MRVVHELEIQVVPLAVYLIYIYSITMAELRNWMTSSEMMLQQHPWKRLMTWMMCVLCNYCKSLKINFNKETEISLLVSRLPDTGNPETRKPELPELTLNMKFVQFLIHDAKYDSWQDTTLPSYTQSLRLLYCSSVVAWVVVSGDSCSWDGTVIWTIFASFPVVLDGLH